MAAAGQASTHRRQVPHRERSTGVAAGNDAGIERPGDGEADGKAAPDLRRQRRQVGDPHQGRARREDRCGELTRRRRTVPGHFATLCAAAPEVAAAASGSRSEKTLPFPGAEVTWISPPWASTSPLTMKSPSPSPSPSCRWPR